MSKLFMVCVLFVSATRADLLTQKDEQVEVPSRSATLKPLSVCCDIPEMGNPTPLAACSNPKLSGLCNEVQCIFDKSGFLTDKNTLNKNAYINHLRQWAEKNKGWNLAVEKAINDCVETEPRQHLDVPCKAYDVFTCTGIAILKKCPDFAWKCK